MNVKNCNIEVKGIDLKNRIVEGYFAAFEIVDSDNDVFVKGAFTKSINERGPKGANRIKHLFNHWDTVGVLQELTEDNYGLRYVSKIGTHRLGEDVLKMYQDGIITEHSVGFQTIQDKSDIIDGVRYLKEVILWEGSSLDKWGANEWTPVIKSYDDWKLQAQKISEKLETLNKALTGRTNYTEETYQEIQIKLNTLQTMFSSLIESQPINITAQINEPKESKGSDDVRIELLLTKLKEL